MFKYDNPIFNILNKIADCAFLGVLWFAFSLPVITIGAATTALYYATVKVVRREQSHAWTEFFDAFKSNFKQSTVIWLLYLAICAVLCAGIFVSWRIAPANSVMGVVAVALVLLLNVAVTLAFFTLAYTARFIFPTKRILLNCLLIYLGNFGWGLVLWFLLFLTLQLLLFMPVLIVVIAAPVVLVMSFTTERVFRKFMSIEDREQDIWQTRKHHI